MILNTRADLDAMKGTPDYAAALTAILGATTTWVNHGTAEAPDWRQETALSHVERLAFPSLEAFLAECAAHGIAPGEPEPPVADPAPEPEPPTEAAYAAVIQAHVDATARGRSYNDGVHLASYVASAVPAWAAEAAVFVAWRDAVWVYAYQQLAAVAAEQRAQPTPAELVAELPAIVWPE